MSMPDPTDTPSEQDQSQKQSTGLEFLLTSGSPNQNDTGFGAVNQQLHSQLFYTKEEYQARHPHTPIVAWHSQSQRMARMAKPEVVKAIVDADKLVGIPPEMHLKFIGGIENPNFNPDISLYKGGQGIGQVLASTAQDVITKQLPKTEWGRKILKEMPELQMAYNPLNAKMNAVVSGAYIRDIMENKLNIKPDANGAISFSSHEALMRATTDTYLSYNVGPGDGSKISRAYQTSPDVSVYSVGVKERSLDVNPSLYRGRTVRQAYEGIFNKLNINVDRMLAVANDSPQPMAIASQGKFPPEPTANDIRLPTKQGLPHGPFHDMRAEAVKRWNADAIIPTSPSISSSDATKTKNPADGDQAFQLGAKPVPNYAKTAARLGAPVLGTTGPAGPTGMLG